MPATSFGAVILAGGASTRMGRDKAWLAVDGQPLLQRQVEVVRETGAEAVWISGRSGVDYAAMGVPVLLDATPGLGPLAGVHEALRVVPQDLLLVLAVDLPRMTSGLLRWLRDQSRARCGVVPVVGGNWEPLAAFYPRGMERLISGELAAGRLAMRGMIRKALDLGWVRLVEVRGEDAGCFANWNAPDDLSPRSGTGASGTAG